MLHNKLHKARPKNAKNTAHKQEHNSKLDELYRVYAPQLTGMLRKCFGSGPPDPDDVTQLAFQKLIERGETSDIDNIKGFLWRTARNLILNDKKHQSVHTSYVNSALQASESQRFIDGPPENTIGATQELLIVNRTLLNMPQRQRQAFILHRIEGLSVSDVAKKLGISRAPTYRHIQKAMTSIHIALASYHSGQSK
ncbi:MAG: sigma-70 family RNA polymerase sigma factor [Pseudomonadota bacterium]